VSVVAPVYLGEDNHGQTRLEFYAQPTLVTVPRASFRSYWVSNDPSQPLGAGKYGTDRADFNFEVYRMNQATGDFVNKSGARKYIIKRKHFNRNTMNS
jgi:hypothetical protein